MAILRRKDNPLIAAGATGAALQAAGI